MKMTCPTCDGKELLDDLSLVETDLYYSRGNLRGVRQADSQKGPPALSCMTCFGQGWIDSAGGGNIFFLHQVDGFWVILDATDRPEALFTQDPSGFVVITQATEIVGSLSPYPRGSFTVIN